MFSSSSPKTKKTLVITAAIASSLVLVVGGGGYALYKWYAAKNNNNDDNTDLTKRKGMYAFAPPTSCENEIDLHWLTRGACASIGGAFTAYTPAGDYKFGGTWGSCKASICEGDKYKGVGIAKLNTPSSGSSKSPYGSIGTMTLGDCVKMGGAGSGGTASSDLTRCHMFYGTEGGASYYGPERFLAPINKCPAAYPKVARLINFDSAQTGSLCAAVGGTFDNNTGHCGMDICGNN